jgi:hypothetical protein
MMRQLSLVPAALAMSVAIACAGTVAMPAVLRAQDAGHHDDQPHDQQPRDQQQPQDNHRDDHQDHPAARPDDHGGDPVARYRHDHPGSTARCHDGFFTRTTDRGRACSKHGGIDVWIAL